MFRWGLCFYAVLLYFPIYSNYLHINQWKLSIVDRVTSQKKLFSLMLGIGINFKPNCVYISAFFNSNLKKLLNCSFDTFSQVDWDESSTYIYNDKTTIIHHVLLVQVFHLFYLLRCYCGCSQISKALTKSLKNLLYI